MSSDARSNLRRPEVNSQENIASSCNPQESSCILFHDEQKSVFLVDIPRSLEEAQSLPLREPHQHRRIVSVKPFIKPFPTPEPKHGEDQPQVTDPTALLSELMTSAFVKSALETVKKSHIGPFCLPRILMDPLGRAAEGEELPAFIPKGAHYFQGTIEGTREEFLAVVTSSSSSSSSSPSPSSACTSDFQLIVLDPPWPNRSAKRKRGGYTIMQGPEDTRELLSQIPIASVLSPDGLVAIWVTNKPSLVDILTNPSNGMLGQWGLEVAAEWSWLKITSGGEPLYDLESSWRKPWERLIIARKAGNSSVKVPPRVVLAVPDLHSRKPNLRPLFADLLPSNFCGLEVFARNLTAGWWAWGLEVLLFQSPNCWVVEGVEDEPAENCA